MPEQESCQAMGDDSFSNWGPQIGKLSFPRTWHGTCWEQKVCQVALGMKGAGEHGVCQPRGKSFLRKSVAIKWELCESLCVASERH